MAMSTGAKLGLSTGIGFASTILTDSALRYWAARNPEGAVADANGVKPQNWYYQYSSLLGGAVSLAAAGVLWKTLGKEEALVCAIAGIGTALAIPARTWVDDARITAETSARGLGRVHAMNQLPQQVRQAA